MKPLEPPAEGEESEGEHRGEARGARSAQLAGAGRDDRARSRPTAGAARPASCSSPIRASAPTAARFIADAMRAARPRCSGRATASPGMPAGACPTLPVERTEAHAGALAAEFYGRPPSRSGCAASPAPTARPRAASGSRRRSRATARKAARDRHARRRLSRRARGAGPNTTPDAVALQALLKRFASRARRRSRWKCRRSASYQGRVERRAVRLRAVHQPLARPPRLPRHDGSVRRRRRRGCSSRRGSQHAVLNLDDALGVRARAAPRWPRRAHHRLQPRAARRATGGRVPRAPARSSTSSRAGPRDAATAGRRRASTSRTCSACSAAARERASPSTRRRRLLALAAAVPGRMQRGRRASRSSSSTTRTRPTRSRRCCSALRAGRARRAAAGWSCVFGCGGDRDPASAR